MKLVTVTRFGYTPMGTFGKLGIDGTSFEAYTLELPWKSNEHGVSCIPNGLYKLKLIPAGVHHVPAAGGPAYLVLNVPQRDGIMMHIANTIDDLKGCIGIGSGLTFMREKWAIGSSTTAFRAFMEAMGGDVDAMLAVRFTKDAPSD